MALKAFVLSMDNSEGDGDVQFDVIGVVMAGTLDQALPHLELLVAPHIEGESAEFHVIDREGGDGRVAEWSITPKGDDRYGTVYYNVTSHEPVKA